jgi:hypothetical protein
LWTCLSLWHVLAINHCSPSYREKTVETSHRKATAIDDLDRISALCGFNL